MAAKGEEESQDFLQPWKFSDVVLVVEEEKLHVHRAVLVLCSPVFERMFTSEFQEKDKNEIPLPLKKLSEVKELLQLIYPSVKEKPAEEITEENCRFLISLAHEYQMAAVVNRCENFMVKMTQKKRKEKAIAELVFAQTYDLQKLKRASIDLAATLSLRQLKMNEMYDQIQLENRIEILEGIIMRLQRQSGCQ